HRLLAQDQDAELSRGDVVDERQLRRAEVVAAELLAQLLLAATEEVRLRRVPVQDGEAALLVVRTRGGYPAVRADGWVALGLARRMRGGRVRLRSRLGHGCGI